MLPLVAATRASASRYRFNGGGKLISSTAISLTSARTLLLISSVTARPSVLLSLTLGLLIAGACGPSIQSTLARAPSPAELAELWEDPGDFASRNLFTGPGRRGEAPDPEAVYRFVKKKHAGFSPGVDVRDPNGVEWSAKEGDEARTEVTASRILWGVGYHQPPIYHLAKWTMVGGEKAGEKPGQQPEARFRAKTIKGMKEIGPWSWQKNPFVGTEPYQGLLVLMMLLNSTDLKNDNNTLYQVTREAPGPKRWYVVRDLGAALGETGRLDPRRGNVALFEKHRFISGVKDGFVEFDFHGRHQELITRTIKPEDVRWACELLARLSERQLQDAFRAGGFAPEITDRYVRKIQEKIAEGKAMR
jgi:hypothetical protein